MAARKKVARRVGARRKRKVKKPLLQDPDACTEEEALTQISDGVSTIDVRLNDLREDLLNKTHEVSERIAEFTDKELQELRDEFERLVDGLSNEASELVENIEVRRDEVKYQREESED